MIYIGTNGKMTEAAAAMGLTNLESLPVILDANRRNYLAYRRALDPLPGVRVVVHDESERRNFQYVVLEVDPAFGLTRDELVRVLHAEGIRARRYFWPGCHRMEPYRTLFPDPSSWLPKTEEVAARVVVMPTGLPVGEDDIERVARVFRLVSAHVAQIAGRLRETGSPHPTARSGPGAAPDR